MKKRDKVIMIACFTYLTILAIVGIVGIFVNEILENFMTWHNSILVICLWIFIVYLRRSYDREIDTLEQERTKLAKNVYENITTSKLQENLKQSIKEIDVAIERYQATINNKKYCGEKQLKNVQAKLENAIKHKKMLEDKLLYGKQRGKAVAAEITATVQKEEKKDSFKEKQDLICNEIEKIMKNQFGNVAYSIKRSESTSSVYLSFTNSHNIQKTIRFSDHCSAKNIRQYSEKTVFSNKAMVRIIESNLKSLSKKTVIVLLKQLGKKGEV